MKNNIILVSALLLLCSVGSAQKANDKTLFDAMRAEMQREMKELRLPDYSTPYYMSYMLKDAEYASVAANLGVITSDKYVPCERNAGVNLYTGDYTLNNDARYQLQYAISRTVSDDNPAQIRRDLWRISDLVYKSTASAYQNKVAALSRQNDHNRLPDMLRAEPVTVVNDAMEDIQGQREQMRQMAKELSTVFAEYPHLYNSAVQLTAMQYVVRIVSSEGATIQQPVMVYALSAMAATDMPEGEEDGGSLAEYYSAAEGWPSVDELRTKIHGFAKGLTAKRNAPNAEEYYYGPVMYEGPAVVSTFMHTLLSPKTLVGYRKPVEAQSAVTTLTARVGKKVVDTRFTVKNYTALEEYNGKKLMGAYKVDIEGVVPPKEVMLIDKGIFRRTLNSRTQTDISTESTGSMRFGMGNGPGSISICPGILHVSATGGESRESLKAKLIERAKEGGNDCAYIVRVLGEEIYRVDLETGEEMRVRNAGVPVPAFNKLDRLMGISDKEQIVNMCVNDAIPATLICPTAILVEDIEVTPKEVKKEKYLYTKNPLER